MNKPTREQTVNGLREKYFKKGPYSIDSLCDLGLFTPEEIEILKKYGHWFYALVYGQVPLVTEKQKQFVKAQKKRV